MRFFIWLLLCSSVVGSDLDIAARDRLQFPSADHPYLYYFSLEPIPEEDWAETTAVLNFVLASSSQQPIVEHCKAVEITPSLLRIDTRSLMWSSTAAHTLFSSTPYKRHSGGLTPLVHNPLWLITAISDSTEGDFYNSLLYGKKRINQSEWLKLWSTNETNDYTAAYIEGDSGISVQRQRFIVNFPTAIRTEVFMTFDFLELNSRTDPLVNLDYPLGRWKTDPIHDGIEAIAGLPKFSIVSQERGSLQAYALFNRKGEQVPSAPGKLVRDTTGFRNSGVVTNFGSCVQCHTTGLNPLTLNLSKQYLESGATIYTENPVASQKLDLLLLSPLNKIMEESNRDYATGINLVSGLQPEELSRAFSQRISVYDGSVSLQAAASEMFCTVEDLQLAIAYRQTSANDLHPRQASLAQGVPIPRSIWEELYFPTYQLLQNWKQK
jgi:hypothetical protein